MNPSTSVLASRAFVARSWMRGAAAIHGGKRQPCLRSAPAPI